MITAVEVKALHTSGSFCMLISNVKVVDLDNVVFTYTFPRPQQFALSTISPFSMNAAAVRAANRQNLIQGQSVAKYSFLAPLSPASTSSGPWLYYLFEVTSLALANGTQSPAQLCNKAGGVVASTYHLQSALTVKNGPADWCTPGAAMDSAHDKCYLLRSNSSNSCGGNQVGLITTPYNTSCPAICYGPLPSAVLLASVNATVLETPVALDVSYVTIADINATVLIATGGQSTTLPPPPPPTPAPPAPCNATVSFSQQGDPWVSNGETIRQYNLAFQNVGTQVVTALSIHMPSGAVKSFWNMNYISTDLYSITVSSGMPLPRYFHFTFRF